MTPVDGDQILVGKLSTAEEDLHKELVIDLLESYVRWTLYMEGKIGVSQKDQINLTQQLVSRKLYW